MLLLAYFETRPYIFVGLFPIFLLLIMALYKVMKFNLSFRQVAPYTVIAYIVLFTFFLTGFGPFFNQQSYREYPMKWEVKEFASIKKEQEVILSFLDFPGHYIGEYSDELAKHLVQNKQDQVRVVFSVTSSYGQVRGFNPVEVAGLRNWKSEWAYAGTKGSPSRSPWD